MAETGVCASGAAASMFVKELERAGKSSIVSLALGAGADMGKQVC